MENCTQLLDDSFDENTDPPDIGRSKVGTLTINGVVHDIYKGENVIGRDDLADIVINSSAVSVKHAVVEVEDWDFHFMYDCGSSNKTRIAKVVLKPNVRYNLVGGEEIMFANVRATYSKLERTQVLQPENNDTNSDTGSESVLNIDTLDVGVDLDDDNLHPENGNKQESIHEREEFCRETNDARSNLVTGLNDSSVFLGGKDSLSSGSAQVVDASVNDDDTTDEEEDFIQPSQTVKEFKNSKKDAKVPTSKIPDTILTEDIFNVDFTSSHKACSNGNRLVKNHSTDIFEMETQDDDIFVKDLNNTHHTADIDENTQNIFNKETHIQATSSKHQQLVKDPLFEAETQVDCDPLSNDKIVHGKTITNSDKTAEEGQHTYVDNLFFDAPTQAVNDSDKGNEINDVRKTKVKRNKKKEKLNGYEDCLKKNNQETYGSTKLTLESSCDVENMLPVTIINRVDDATNILSDYSSTSKKENLQIDTNKNKDPDSSCGLFEEDCDDEMSELLLANSVLIETNASVKSFDQHFVGNSLQSQSNGSEPKGLEVASTQPNEHIIQNRSNLHTAASDVKSNLKPSKSVKKTKKHTAESCGKTNKPATAESAKEYPQNENVHDTIDSVDNAEIISSVMPESKETNLTDSVRSIALVEGKESDLTLNSKNNKACVNTLLTDVSDEMKTVDPNKNTNYKPYSLKCSKTKNVADDKQIFNDLTQVNEHLSTQIDNDDVPTLVSLSRPCQMNPCDLDETQPNLNLPHSFSHRKPKKTVNECDDFLLCEAETQPYINDGNAKKSEVSHISFDGEKELRLIEFNFQTPETLEIPVSSLGENMVKDHTDIIEQIPQINSEQDNNSDDTDFEDEGNIEKTGSSCKGMVGNSDKQQRNKTNNHSEDVHSIISLSSAETQPYVLIKKLKVSRDSKVGHVNEKSQKVVHQDHSAQSVNSIISPGKDNKDIVEISEAETQSYIELLDSKQDQISDINKVVVYNKIENSSCVQKQNPLKCNAFPLMGKRNKMKSVRPTIEENSNKSQSINSTLPLVIDNREIHQSGDKSRKRNKVNQLYNMIQTKNEVFSPKENQDERHNHEEEGINSTVKLADMEICSTVGNGLYESTFPGINSSKKKTNNIPLLSVNDPSLSQGDFFNGPASSSTPLKIVNPKNPDLVYLRNTTPIKTIHESDENSPLLPSTEELFAVADKTPQKCLINSAPKPTLELNNERALVFGRLPRAKKLSRKMKEFLDIGESKSIDDTEVKSKPVELSTEPKEKVKIKRSSQRLNDGIKNKAIKIEQIEASYNKKGNVEPVHITNECLSSSTSYDTSKENTKQRSISIVQETNNCWSKIIRAKKNKKEEEISAEKTNLSSEQRIRESKKSIQNNSRFTSGNGLCNDSRYEKSPGKTHKIKFKEMINVDDGEDLKREEPLRKSSRAKKNPTEVNSIIDEKNHLQASTITGISKKVESSKRDIESKTKTKAQMKNNTSTKEIQQSLVQKKSEIMCEASKKSVLQSKNVDNIKREESYTNIRTESKRTRQKPARLRNDDMEVPMEVSTFDEKDRQLKQTLNKHKSFTSTIEASMEKDSPQSNSTHFAKLPNVKSNKRIKKTDDTKQDLLSNQDKSRSRGRSRRNGSNTDLSIMSRSGSASSVTSINSGTSIFGSPRRSVKRGEKVLFTGLNNPVLESDIIKLGGEVVDCTTRCTVLVTDKVRRTVKFLCALGQGKPIVTPTWISISSQCLHFEDPMKHLLSDPEAEQKFNFKLSETIQLAKSRLLLTGYNFHATPSVKPPPDDVRGIVESCGGRYLASVPSQWPANSLVISHPDDRVLWKRLKVKGSTPPIITAEALLLGVLQYKLDIDTHRIT